MRSFKKKIILDPDHNIEVLANAVFNFFLTTALKANFTVMQKDRTGVFKVYYP